MTRSSQAWAAHYDSRPGASRYCPENFVVRVFCSDAPVSFLDDKAYAGKTVLDIGCGHGRHVPFLLDLGMDVVGLEISDAQVLRLQAAHPRARFVMGRNTDIPLDDASVDIVLGANAIYYLDDPATPFRTVIDEAARVLKPGGALVCSFVGAQHSILDGAERVGDAAVIRQDFLGFRDGGALRPLWAGERFADLVAPLTLHREGEILETAHGHRRHLHYATALKAV